ncbi:MAG: polysaccharide deacetylase family protein [Kiloniellales bacterium]
MSEVSIQPRIRLAVTIDDLFLWKGVPWPPGCCPQTVVPAITEALARHEMHGIYGFSATAPAEDEDSRQTIFEHWRDAGNRIGNHTHNLVSLNWVSDARFIKDIEASAALLAPWIDENAPKYFRYPGDSCGDNKAKSEAVQAYLADKGYKVVPVDLSFYDSEFLAAHVRFSRAGDDEGVAWLQQRFVETALKQLQIQVALARKMFNRDPVYIWRIHATALAGDCLYDILAAFKKAGVVFVSLAEAMIDPLHRRPAPILTPRFLNHLQTWALHRELAIEEAPPSVLKEIEARHIVEGLSSEAVLTAVAKSVADEVGASFKPAPY